MPPFKINRKRLGGSIPRGIFLLARGRVAGIREFGNDWDALAASLAPLIAFPLVGAGMVAADGQPWRALLGLLSRLCGVLALPVITHAYARLAGRESNWVSTAAALNWSFWVVIPLLLVAAVIGALLAAAGLGQMRAEAAAIVLLGAYMLWLHWFILRAGLQLPPWSAALLVLLTNCAIALLTFGPALAAMLPKGRLW